jgi:sugar phosphate isomerase/epimerase
MMACAPKLSLQLYSARLAGSLEAQLTSVTEAGFTHVEPYQGLYEDGRLPALLAAHGLSAASGHFDLAVLEAEPERVIAIARSLGMSLIVAPWLEPEERPTDTAGWRALGRRLTAVGDRLRGEGFDFAWHNHDFEFQPLADGALPIEILAEDAALNFELDLAWIARADADPVLWLDRLSGRIAAFHVKDIAPAGENLEEEGWADVGAGILPWATLWTQAIAAGARLAIAEHDLPSDFDRFARRSAAAMRSFSDQE